MRALMLVAALALAACGDDGQPANETAADQSAPREVVPTNDTTAIDAVSGESARMAEDVDFLEANELQAAGNAAAADEAGNSAR